MSTALAVSTVTVFDYEIDAQGKALVNLRVEVELAFNKAILANPLADVGTTRIMATTDSNGYWEVKLIRNTDLLPANTSYTVRRQGRADLIVVPAGAGPFAASGLVVAQPPPPPPVSPVQGPTTFVGPVTFLGGIKVVGPYYDLAAEPGADPGGVIDNKPAITSWLAHRPVGIYHAGPGSWATTGPITPPQFAELWGDGDSTAFTVPPALWSLFPGYTMLIQGGGFGGGTDVTVRRLRVDGQWRNRGGFTAPPGGGIFALGDRWKLYNVHEYDSWGFGFWVNFTNSAKMFDCESSLGSGNDHIGGGANHDFHSIRHRWNAGMIGNCFDFVNGSAVVRDGLSLVAPGNGNFYLEGMNDTDILDNRIFGGGISMQSDSGYAPATVTNALRCRVQGNRLLGGGTIYYTGYFGASPQTKGGVCEILKNWIILPTYYGILWQIEDVNNSYGHGRIEDNTVIDANDINQVGNFNTGGGIIDVSGINVISPFFTSVRRNRVFDTRLVKRMRYALQVGGGGVGTPNGCYVEENDLSPGVLGRFNARANLPTDMQIRNNPGLNPAGYLTPDPTPSGSPWTYTNLDYYPEDVLVTGGTVSLITKGGQTVATGSNQGMIHLEPGEAITITHTGAPAVKRFAQ